MDLKQYFEETGDTQEKLADRLKITQGAVSQWLKNRVPAERVLDVERETDGKVSPHAMRPDIYPAEVFSSAV